MLSIMRNAVRTPIAGVFIGLLIISMAAWGITDIFSGNLGNNIAKAGNRTLTEEQLTRTIDRFIRGARNQGQNTTRQELAEQGFLPGLIRSVANQETILAYADENGLASPHAAAVAEIELNRDAYRQMVANGAESFESIVTAITDERTINYITSASGTALDLPDSYYASFADFMSEVRRVAFFEIKTDDVEEVTPPTDEEILALYNDRISAFEQPERRAVSILSFSVDDFTAQVELAEEDVRAEYDAQKARFSEPASRRYVQFALDSREDALEVAGRLAGGDDTDAIAELDTVILSEELTGPRNGISDLDYAQAIFTAYPDGVVGPLEVGQFWYVAKILEEIPGEAFPFEDVRPLIEEELVPIAAEELLYRVLDTIDDGIGGGLTLEEIATDVGAPVISYPAVGPRGVTEAGEVVQTFGALEDSLTLAFELFTDEVSERQQSDNAFYVMRLDEVVPPRTLPLEDVRDQIADYLLAQKETDALQALAAEITARMDAGTSFISQEAEQLGTAVVRPPEGVTRNAPAGSVFPASGINQAFSASLGKSFTVPVAGGILIGVLESLDRVSASQMTGLQAAARTQTNEAIATDLEQSFLTDIRESVGVEFNEPAIQAYIAALQGEQ